MMHDTNGADDLAHDQHDQLLELTFHSRPDCLKVVRAAVYAAARACGFDDASAQDIVLAVDEACSNVIVHAYRWRGDGDIVLTIFRLVRGIRFHLRDYGPPVSMAHLKPRALDDVAPGGLGTHFIREIMDDSQITRASDGRGNVLILTKQSLEMT